MTPEFAARELLHSLQIDCVPTRMEEICARLGVVIERSDEIDAEALLIVDGTGEVVKVGFRSFVRRFFLFPHYIGCLVGNVISGGR